MASSKEQRDGRRAHKAQLPADGDRDDEAGQDRGRADQKHAHHGPAQSFQVCCAGGKQDAEGPGRMLCHVEEGHVLPQKMLEDGIARPSDKSLGAECHCYALSTLNDDADKGKHQHHRCPEVDILPQLRMVVDIVAEGSNTLA